MTENTNVETVRTIIQDSNPDLNVRVASPIYTTLILPQASVYQEITTQLESNLQDAALSTATTDERADELLTNFGVSRNEGNPAVGEITLTLSNNLEFYSFPEGTQFNHSSGLILETTESVIVNTNETTTQILDVQTTAPTSKVLEIGEVVSTTVYATLVETSLVSQQVSGGKDRQTNDELVDEINTNLTTAPTNPIGLRASLLKKFPTLIDARVLEGTFKSRSGLNRDPGIPIDVLIKSSLQSVTTTLPVSGGVVMLEDTAFNITGTSSFTVTTENQGTIYEKNILSVVGSASTITLTYFKPTLLQNVQAYLDGPDRFPMGVDVLARVANPVLISGSLDFRGGALPTDISEYIQNHLIANFVISDFVTALGSSTLQMPVSLDFIDQYTLVSTKVDDIYESIQSAYYIGSIQVQ